MRTTAAVGAGASGARAGVRVESPALEIHRAAGLEIDGRGRDVQRIQVRGAVVAVSEAASRIHSDGGDGDGARMVLLEDAAALEREGILVGERRVLGDERPGAEGDVEARGEAGRRVVREGRTPVQDEVRAVRDVHAGP